MVLGGSLDILVVRELTGGIYFGSPKGREEGESPALSGWDAFGQMEIRVGTTPEAILFPEARVPAIKLRIDFGGGDVRWTSAQLTNRYTPTISRADRSWRSPICRPSTSPVSSRSV